MRASMRVYHGLWNALRGAMRPRYLSRPLYVRNALSSSGSTPCSSTLQPDGVGWPAAGIAQVSPIVGMYASARELAANVASSPKIRPSRVPLAGRPASLPRNVHEYGCPERDSMNMPKLVFSLLHIGLSVTWLRIGWVDSIVSVNRWRRS